MSLVRNSVANVLGSVLPSLVTIITTPLLLHHLGIANYGLLTIITAITGYFAIIDINLTAGSVKYVSEYHARGETTLESQTIVLGFLVYLLIGILGGLALYFFAAPLAHGLFDIAPSQDSEAIRTLKITGLAFLLGQIQQYLNSLPQALQRYDLTAKTESFFGIFIPVLSVLLVMNGQGIYQLLQLRIAASALNILLLLLFCRRLFPAFKLSLPGRPLCRTLLTFSGYAYLSKVASLSYAHADKLIIGSLLGMEAVALYSIPATIVGRILGLSFRMSSVIFPAASHMAARGEWEPLKQIYADSTRYLAYFNGIAVGFICLFSYELLYYWMGAQIAASGWMVLILIGLSLYADTFTNIPSLVNDGLGHSKISGGFAFVRSLIGVGITWLMARYYGVNGVAAGHLAAAVISALLFIGYVHGRTVPVSLRVYLKNMILPVMGFGMAFIVLFWLKPAHLLNLWQLIFSASVLLLLMMALGVFFVLRPEHRQQYITRYLSARGA